MDYRIGLDIGSTTIKCVVIDSAEKIIFKLYKRHNAKILESLIEVFDELYNNMGDMHVSLGITGSVGMGIAEKCGFQEIWKTDCDCFASAGDRRRQCRRLSALLLQ